MLTDEEVRIMNLITEAFNAYCNLPEVDVAERAYVRSHVRAMHNAIKERPTTRAHRNSIPARVLAFAPRLAPEDPKA